jgi:GT2 family glycosyltransferase
MNTQRHQRDAEFTVVVVPRERFSCAAASLESIYSSHDGDLNLVYVDANSPPALARELALQSQRRGFQLVHTDRYLSPNQARNLGQSLAHTKYVIFVDNDVTVLPSCFEKLVETANQTGAWVVGPLYLEGARENPVIHMAGGSARIVNKDGRRQFEEKHYFAKHALSDVETVLASRPVDTVEFHCVLVRKDVFARLGPLDEKLLSVSEHIDFALAVQAAGGVVYLEPSARVIYDTASPFAETDLPYFRLRWSDEWNQASAEHFRKKWNLLEDDPYTASVLRWSQKHRRLASQTRLPWQLRRFFFRARTSASELARKALGLP